MKKSKVILLGAFIVVLMIAARIGLSTKSIKDDITYSFNDLAQYKSQYMGDGSNTTSLFNKLLLNEYQRSYQLYPDNLKVELKFESKVSEVKKKELDRALVYNSTIAFSLIENLEDIQYNFDGEIFIVKREEVESWYDFALIDLFDDEKRVDDLIEKIKQEGFIKKCLSKIVS